MIARLRSDSAPQPRCDAALAAWRDGTQVSGITAALARYGADTPLVALPDLAQVLDDHGAARALAQGLITPLIAALRVEPLAQVPLTHSAAPGFVRLRLASSHGAALTLAAYAQRPLATPASALFEDCEAHEIVIAGEGGALCHRLIAGQLTSEPMACAPGTRLTRHGPDSARQFVAVTRPLLVLQLTREPAHPVASREIALADGVLLKTISGCKRSSQQMMALAVLGALGHRGGLSAMAQLAQDRSAARDLRWEALRHSLALDAPTGLTVLARLAQGRDDPLATPAAALEQQLRASRPDLAALLQEPA